jgi:hypothetical protein
MGTEDRLVSAAALLATALLASQVLQPAPAPRVDPPLGAEPALVEARVTALAEAIAVSEGYYAPGRHDGHSLPYRLHNPGALKKPALGAAALPTWQDTGLIDFPSTTLGWAALRHQVRLMLTGASGVYRPTDTLRGVAIKYAAGDAAWGGNVAAHLGIHPGATLAEVAGSASR